MVYKPWNKQGRTDCCLSKTNRKINGWTKGAIKRQWETERDVKNKRKVSHRRTDRKYSYIKIKGFGAISGNMACKEC